MREHRAVGGMGGSRTEGAAGGPFLMDNTGFLAYSSSIFRVTSTLVVV